MMMAFGKKTYEIALLCGAILLAASISTASASILLEQRPPILPPPPTPTPRPRLGVLIVTSQKGARVKVRHIARDKPIEKTISDEERQAIFNPLTPGNYIVSAELDGYERKEKKITVPAKDITTVALILEPITYAVTIQTNINSGDIYYRQDGETNKQVSISNGRADLPKLAPGKYLIDVKPTEVIYRSKQESIVVDKDHTNFKIELLRIESRIGFNEPWLNLDRWEAPPRWQTMKAALSIDDEGVSLRRNETERYYLDVKILITMKIVNGAASFIVRALDKQNYYLIRISAPSGSPGMVSATVVRNGQERELYSHPIYTLKEGWATRHLEVEITTKGNKIEVHVQDTGDASIFIASFTDEANTFPIGAPGFAARKGEQAMIGRYVVEPIL